MMPSSTSFTSINSLSQNHIAMSLFFPNGKTQVGGISPRRSANDGGISYLHHQLALTSISFAHTVRLWPICLHIHPPSHSSLIILTMASIHPLKTKRQYYSHSNVVTSPCGIN